MFKCKIENIKNNILTLTQNESNYQLLSITGLNPPNAQINTSTIAGLDGSKFNSSKVESRNIVITLKINADIEANRINLYKYFATKEWCKFYYENENRNVYIDCYVENFECDLFVKNEIAQISLICPNPYFKDMETIIDDISKAIAAFKFPFSINTNNYIPVSTIDTSKVTNVYNDSESETGMIIEVNVLNKINSLQIKNVSTGETFGVKYSFVENDRIIIDTNKGEKSIKLIRDGLTSNIFTAMTKGSTFFQLDVGDNYFSYLVDDGVNDNLVQIRFKHYTLYRGV